MGGQNQDDYQVALDRIRECKENERTELSFWNLNIDKIPEEISEILDLKELNLRSVPISALNSLIPLVNLERLYLSDTKIVDLSPLAFLVNLKELDLRFTLISDLNSLSSLMNLKVLDLSDTKISDLSLLSSLVNLQRLELSSTPISNLNSLSSFVNLERLGLNSTLIIDLNPLKSLVKLQILDLSSTPISDLNPLKSLVKLQILDLNSTQTSDLNPLISLAKLQILDLRNSKIIDIRPLEFLIKKRIPLKMGRSGLGNSICLSGNPLQYPPIEKIKEGNAAVLRYFGLLRKTKEKVYLNEAKILLIGRTGVGKTSLRKKLRNPDALMPANQDSTHGIDVETLTFQAENKKNYKMHLWDFEGQQVSLQTHQFFLSKRALYLFVTDSRTEKSDVDDWLKTVSLLSNNSPVLLFHNEKAKQICTLSPDAYDSFRDMLGKEEYRVDLNAVAVDEENTISSDCSHQPEHLAAFQEFEKYLKEQVKKMEIISVPVTPDYIKIRTAIAERAKEVPHINWVELKAICRKNNITVKQEQDDLTQLFHDLGIYLLTLRRSKIRNSPKYY